MSEIVRYTMARRPERRLLAPHTQVPVYLRAEGTSPLLATIIDAFNPPDEGPVALGHGAAIGHGPHRNPLWTITAAADAFLASPGFLDPDRDPPAAGLEAELRGFDRWLVSAAKDKDDPDVPAVGQWLAGAAIRLGHPDATEATAAQVLTTQDKGWRPLCLRLGDSLVATLLGTDKVGNVGRAQKLTRLVLVAGLVASLGANDPAGMATAQDVRDLLLRFPVLPSPPFPLEKFLPIRSVLARTPAFSDLYVVRDEWSCYVPGEIAYIENVLKGEKRERLNKRLDEAETTTTGTSETSTLEETGTQTTERSSVKEESQHDTDLNIGVEAQVNVSASYGTMKLDAHMGASLEYSVHDAQDRATETAKETVSRAISRVETKISQARTQRTLTRVEERNRHLIDNSQTPEGNVVGMYRWVDKVQRYQIFRYPHRYLLEFELPEPGAFLRWLQQRPKPAAQGVVRKPPAFTVDGKDQGEPLTLADITPDSYAGLAARYLLTGLPEPPSPTVTVTTSFEVTAGERDKSNHNYADQPFAPTGSAHGELTVPPGYEAYQAYAAVGAAPELGNWLDWEDTSGHSNYGINKNTGWHSVTATVQIAGTVGKVYSPTTGPAPNTVFVGSRFYPDLWLSDSVPDLADRQAWPLPSPVVEKVAASAVVGGAFKAAVSVALVCRPTSAAQLAWAADVFTQLAAAYANQLDQWSREQHDLATPVIGAITGSSPTRNAQMTRDELKRQVIEALLGRQFDGMDGMDDGTDNDRPRVNFDHARTATPYVQFLEQALEWTNMTYVCYPYYWSPGGRWPTLQPIETADPAFDEFLRAGSARVVVPARPGFAAAVNHFTIFGQPWGGGPAPIPGDELYVAVAREIMDLTGAPDDGEPGESWEAKVPTTLVWLDPDVSLPRQNAARTLTEPAHPICGP